jgi:hypothetical protein
LAALTGDLSRPNNERVRKDTTIATHIREVNPVIFDAR